jgi:hypothetical protein
MIKLSKTGQWVISAFIMLATAGGVAYAIQTDRGWLMFTCMILFMANAFWFINLTVKKDI